MSQKPGSNLPFQMAALIGFLGAFSGSWLLTELMLSSGLSAEAEMNVMVRARIYGILLGLPIGALVGYVAGRMMLGRNSK
jgi:uncharacterized membrane protein YeaQ/YmgE (transglycosylase-associated protein family)